MTTEKPEGPQPKSPRVEARRRRDEAMRKLGEVRYRDWLASGRGDMVTMAPGERDALKAVDDACCDVALQA